MEDLSKSKQSSTGEMASLRRRVPELEQSESERKRAEEALLATEENFHRAGLWMSPRWGYG